MLDVIRRGQRWLTGIFIGVIGLVFAAFIGLGGPLSPDSSATAVVELDGHEYDLFQFERIRARQDQAFREALGDQYDARTAGPFLDTQALRLLVDGAVLSYAAEELGLRVSKDEIQRTVRNMQGFRDESGRFDRERFLDQVEYEYGSQRSFVDILRQDLLRTKLARLLFAQAQVSDGEARGVALHSLERVQIAFLAIDTAELPPGTEVSEEAVAEYLAAHEDELLETYAERADEFQKPEKVRARHIFFRVEDFEDEAEVEEARGRAEAALARIRQGAAFEDVALELSEDPGSREKGGDLGLFARGEVNPVLEERAFSLDLYAVSDVVQSDTGFHVVRPEERIEARTQTFDELGLELAREVAEASLADETGRAQAERIAQAIRDGESLEAAARAEALTLERTGMLGRRPDGFIPGLGSAPEVLSTAFALTPERPSSPRIFEAGTRLVLVQLLDRNTPEQEVLRQAAEAQKQRLLEEKRNGLLQSWIDHRRDTLVADNLLQVNADLISGR
ncbi:MAG: SurA N-terminal domain-containing protein [Proteobacteria bacterium]|nr:SurA N-terminal domain-containing protein [Pseudomonadota bacterium]